MNNNGTATAHYDYDYLTKLSCGIRILAITRHQLVVCEFHRSVLRRGKRRDGIPPGRFKIVISRGTSTFSLMEGLPPRSSTRVPGLIFSFSITLNPPPSNEGREVREQLIEGPDPDAVFGCDRTSAAFHANDVSTVLVFFLPNFHPSPPLA